MAASAAGLNELEYLVFSDDTHGDIITDFVSEIRALQAPLTVRFSGPPELFTLAVPRPHRATCDAFSRTIRRSPRCFPPFSQSIRRKLSDIRSSTAPTPNPFCMNGCWRHCRLSLAVNNSNLNSSGHKPSAVPPPPYLLFSALRNAFFRVMMALVQARLPMLLLMMMMLASPGMSAACLTLLSFEHSAFGAATPCCASCKAALSSRQQTPSSTLRTRVVSAAVELTVRYVMREDQPSRLPGVPYRCWMLRTAGATFVATRAMRLRLSEVILARASAFMR